MRPDRSHVNDMRTIRRLLPTRERPYCDHDPQECGISGTDRNASADHSVGGGFHQYRFGRRPWSDSGDGTSEIAGLSDCKPDCHGVFLRFQQSAISISEYGKISEMQVVAFEQRVSGGLAALPSS